MESDRERKIRERAYALWVEGGQSPDSSHRDWLTAEQEVGAAPGSSAEGPDASSGSEGAKVAKKTVRTRSQSVDSTSAKEPAVKTGAKRQSTRSVATKNVPSDS